MGTDNVSTSASSAQSREIWKAVPGFEGHYEVSNRGRVRSLDRMIPSRWGGEFLKKGRVLQGHNDNGYRRVNLCKDGSPSQHQVHRLVAAAFIGPCPEGCEVNHKNFDRSDNRVENLEYVTPAENVAHATRNGHVGGKRGEKHYRARLSTEDVEEIKELVAAGNTQSDVAERFGVGQSHVSRIVNNKSRRDG